MLILDQQLSSALGRRRHHHAFGPRLSPHHIINDLDLELGAFKTRLSECPSHQGSACGHGGFAEIWPQQWIDLNLSWSKKKVLVHVTIISFVY